MIPFIDLQAQYAEIGIEVENEILRVLRNGQYVLGPEVQAFESEFATFCGTKHAVGVNSGTSALHIALRACNIGPGDEVITVPFTFVGTVAAINFSGAHPRLVDIDPQSFTMDPNKIEAQITERTKAIIPVHLFGQAADMDPILSIAKKFGLTVIEDACQAHGATYNGQLVGGLGDIGCFSFYPSKNLGSCGEAGIVVTNDPNRAHNIQMLRNWGQDQKGNYVIKGGNYRLDTLQAAVLRVKLPHTLKWNEARRTLASRYNELLASIDLKTPTTMPYAKHVYHVYAVQTQKREALRQGLETRGIGVKVHYPLPIHLQPAYAELGYKEGDFPCSEKTSKEIISLPIYPQLSNSTIETIVDAVRYSMP